MTNFTLTSNALILRFENREILAYSLSGLYKLSYDGKRLHVLHKCGDFNHPCCADGAANIIARWAANGR